jgi:hypothetical protein
MLITVTRSAGDDRATLVFIDDVDPKNLRILVNDGEAFVGKPYQMLDNGRGYEAKDVQFQVAPDDIAYTGNDLEGDALNLGGES